ncbi:MAG: hypothetical protein B1H08_00815 [Candidatus Omnitrophica bacterium 4484_171]|nr:MAG: hypothetical protein B1H08_00815 [Candidatus Omnitrophica bacterium 4484_171]
MKDLDKIKMLRESTSLGISDCKNALKESDGDFSKALELLKKKGISVMEKKKGRTASQGLIEAYIHFGGNLGAMVEVNCETDFVAKTEVFKRFVKDLAMHVAAASPKYLDKNEIKEDELKNVSDADEYIKETCLLKQAFVKDNSRTIEDYLHEVVSQTGENVVIKRFVRYSLGE